MAMYDRLARARFEHCRLSAGKLPAGFELHPEHWLELRTDRRMVQMTTRTQESDSFMGVPIRISRLVIQPVMVTSEDVRIEI
jgi:hypothetical protein